MDLTLYKVGQGLVLVGTNPWQRKELKQIGGRWSPELQGWIFYSNKEVAVQEWIQAQHQRQPQR